MTILDPPVPSLIEALADDPYPYYRWLREHSPVHVEPSLDLTLISRHADVVAVLHDPEAFSSEQGMGRFFRQGLGSPEGGVSLADAMVGVRVLIATDPPDHTRLRQIVNRAFTPKAISALEPHIRHLAAGMVDDLVAVADATGEVDLVEHLAIPLPVIVIAELLGIPPEDRHQFRRWSDDMVAGLGGQGDLLAAQTAGIEMFKYFGHVAAERREHPQDDLISRIVDREGTDGLGPLEVLSFCVLLLLAGNETTTNLLGNLTAALFDHPDAAAELWADPSLVPAAVEEALRYDGPIQGLFRAATRDLTIAGTDVPRGTIVMPLFGSANRDANHIDDPDRFDLHRGRIDHVAFGHGIHFCLGAALARLEATAAFSALIARTASIGPAGSPTRVESLALRGFSRLPISLEPRS